MQYTFMLSGADGEQHEYIGTPIPPAAGGTALALQIYALSGGALGAMLKGLMDSMGGLGGLIERFNGAGIADLNIEELLGDLDLGALGDALASSLSKLPPRALQDLLAHTSRDGKPLRQELNFNAAYRGNYPELLIAVATVAYHNGFFTSGAMPAIKKAAPQQSDDSETPTASPQE